MTSWRRYSASFSQGSYLTFLWFRHSPIFLTLMVRRCLQYIGKYNIFCLFLISCSVAPEHLCKTPDIYCVKKCETSIRMSFLELQGSVISAITESRKLPVKTEKNKGHKIDLYLTEIQFTGERGIFIWGEHSVCSR